MFATLFSGLKAKLKKRKKRSRRSQRLEMRLPAILPLERLHARDTDNLVDWIRAFPLEAYELYAVPAVGLFYIDPIDDEIKNLLRKGAAWEAGNQQLMQRYIRPGSIALDIGAHIGTHTLAMSRAVGATGRVLAFEPQPKIFRELFLNTTINGCENVDFHFAGVSNREGVAELSSLTIGNEGGTEIRGGTGQVISLLALDSLGLTDVSFMKIDVEGMEDLVLEGARETILRSRPVMLVEICGGHSLQTAPPAIRQKILNTLHQLESLGYRVEQVAFHDWLALPLG